MLALPGLNFLSVYAALSLAYHTHNSPGALVLAAAAVGLGAFKVGGTAFTCMHSAARTRVAPSAAFTLHVLTVGAIVSRIMPLPSVHAPAYLHLQTWLRVFLGFHTWPQVLVGAALGASTAVTWFKLGTAWALPAVRHTPGGLGLLYTVTVLGSLAFAYKVITGWFKEQRRKQQLSGKVKVALDTFAEEEFEELTRQLSQKAEAGETTNFCQTEQHWQSGDRLRNGESEGQPSAGTTPSFAS